ncbi:MAG TPA: polysaccharide biosynthesis/export family protein [Gemmatimonadales bacterium]
MGVTCLAGVTRAQAQGQAPAPSGDVLVTGDLVRITVWEKPELSGEFLVNPEGTLAHPLYQEVKVAGVPLSVAKQRLREFLAASYTKDPLIVVEPLLRVTVGGQVNAPNVYSVPRGTTITQAVALAGGATNEAKLSNTRVLRGGQIMKLDLTKADAAGAGQTVKSGDQVQVGRRGNFFRDGIGPFASLTAAVISIVVVVRQ